LLVDTSIARNFAIAGWVQVLAALSQGTIRVAQGVLGVGPDEPGELDRAKEFFDRQTRIHPAGSPEYTHALLAAMHLQELISRRSTDLEVVVPTLEELGLAIRLQAREAREWRRNLGMRARRLDAGEAVSLAICVLRNEAFGCDDDDARIAYQSLGGRECLTTLDLARLGVERGLISQDEARTEYEKLRRFYRFFGPPWS
jgi:predicted nucleic acid-binding protein